MKTKKPSCYRIEDWNGNIKFHWRTFETEEDGFDFIVEKDHKNANDFWVVPLYL